MRKILSIVIALLSVGCLQAQTPLITDGVMMPKKDLGMGLFYGNNEFKKYWEGTRKQENENIGTITTQSVTWMGAYGISKKVTAIAMLPYIWTKASGGTLHGMEGIQDLTLAVKYNFFDKNIDKSNIKFFGLGSFSAPMTDYTPDFLPLSIGQATKNLSGRLTASYTLNQIWNVTASGAYTYRSNIHLDRPSYYTNGQLYYSDEVQMFDLFDFIVRFGYHKDNFSAELFYTQQTTLGGGDIQRWGPVPAPSIRMNASNVGASIRYVQPHLKNFGFRVWSNYTVDGRNVGQSFAVTAGVMYFLHFSKTQ